MMETFESVASLLNYVENQIDNHCEDLAVTTAYPDLPREVPIQKTNVCVGIDKVDLLFQNGTVKGEDAVNRIYYGMDLACCFKLDICMPKIGGSGSACTETFDKIAAVCLNMDRIRVTKMTCGKIHYDRILSAIVMECTMECTAELIKQVSSSTIIS